MRLIIPNYHVILIHFPMALLGLGMVLEFFSFMWRRTSLQQAGRWMILFGTLLLVPAFTSGLYALLEDAHGQPGGGTWESVKAGSGFDARTWEHIKDHVRLTALGSGIALLTVVGYLGSSDRERRRWHFPTLVAMLVAMTLITLGAWHGGELVFRAGLGVSGKFSNFESMDAPQSLRDKIDTEISPIQIHLILAGFVVSATGLAMGFYHRRAAVRAAIKPGNLPPRRNYEDRTSGGPLTSIPSLEDLSISAEVAVPPGRIWVFASFIALLAVISGFYIGGFIGGWPKVIDIPQIRDAIHNLRIDPKQNGRMGLHIVLGAAIFVLLLLAAVAARWRPGSGVLAGLFSILLLAVLSAQIWIGILMMFDTDQGPLQRANPATMPSMPSLPATMPMSPMTTAN